MSDLESKIQQRLDQATSEEDGVPGLVFGAVDRSGKVLVSVASGEEEKGSGRKMKRDSVFAIYSCTKMIAGMACMQLVEKGVLKLDDPDQVAQHLPEVANATFVDGSKPKTRITLRHLLTHTAGFGYTFFNPELKKWEEANGDEFGTSIDCFKSPLLFEPGTEWNYGVNIDWAGELLHRVTGQTLGEYCKQHIFDPLGATDIGFGVQPQHKGRLVAMHQRSPEGKVSVREHTPMTLKGSSFDSAGAGCVGTLDDYLKVLTVLINGGKGANGERIIEQSTLDEMLKDQIEHIAPEKGMERDIAAATPSYTYPIQMMPGVKKGWGLTFQILKDDLPTGRKAGACWWAGLPNLYWVADPASGVAHMVLSQIFPFNSPAVLGPWIDCEVAVYQSLGTSN